MDGDYSEVWTAIGEKIVAESGVTSLLGNAANVFYEEDDLPKGVTYPAIRFSVVSEIPTTQLSAIGDAELRLQIDVFGAAKATNRRIAARIGELLDIPRQLPAGLTTTNFVVRQMQCTSVAAVGDTGVKDSAGRAILQLATDWRLKVTRR